MLSRLQCPALDLQNCELNKSFYKLLSLRHFVIQTENKLQIVALMATVYQYTNDANLPLTSPLPSSAWTVDNNNAQ